MNEQTLSLFELNHLVREVIDYEMNREYWVEAEVSEARTSRGHCYMELVQKDEGSNTPIARASAKCWQSRWSIIEPYFVRTTGQQLHAGMKLRLKVSPQFHEAYGFSWIISDIDPTFTLGDLVRRRQEIIRALKQQGIFDMQKSLELPLFCQRIAVISSQSAAGYGDFAAQLANNDYGYCFQTRLFPAIMQGEQVESSIVAALNSIYNESEAFDCVVIIRGGGATADMSGFDTLALAENVAQFPLPIITGIGHDRDECVLDMVSHLRVKTPTAAAAFLIDHLKQIDDIISEAQDRISYYVQQKLGTLKAQLTVVAEALPRLFTNLKTRQEARLDGLLNRYSILAQKKLSGADALLTSLNDRMPALLERRLLNEKHRLQLTEEKLKSLDPTLLLQRGYSLTLKNGHSVKRADALQPGDIIETRLAEGSILSTVKTINQE